MNARQILVTALFLFLFAVVGTALVAVTYDNTHERIAANERAALLRSLHELIPPDRHDNDIFSDTLEVTDPDLGGGAPVTVYRARKNGSPVAIVLSTVAPDGYSGPIRLLVGIDLDGTLAGVRVLSHRETPGLGDAMEVRRSDWILGFNGRSLKNPEPKLWAVKRDGGIFDQFTGATITPRALVKAVKKSLLYFEHNREHLFETDSAHSAADASTPEAATPEAD